jgi:L-2,4-diaminobutyric acid acetyltransferase
MVEATTEGERPDLEIGPPREGDGRQLWTVARAAGGLDVNPSYAYLLWVRDFAATTAVARDGDRVAAYCTGYLRPDQPDTYFVWQVAVDPDYRRRGLGLRLLDEVVDRTGARALEATVTPDNDASHALFTRFAASRQAKREQRPLFAASDFPDGHDPEDLLRIAPL